MNISSLRQILSADADGLSTVGSCVPRCSRHIVELKAESHIRSIPRSASAVELVPVWKTLQRSVRADEDRLLQKLDNLNHQVPPLWRPRNFSNRDQWRLRVDEKPRGFLYGVCVTLRRRRHRKHRYAQARSILNSRLLKRRVDDKERRPH